MQLIHVHPARRFSILVLATLVLGVVAVASLVGTHPATADELASTGLVLDDEAVFSYTTPPIEILNVGTFKFCAAGECISTSDLPAGKKYQLVTLVQKQAGTTVNFLAEACQGVAGVVVSISGANSGSHVTALFGEIDDPLTAVNEWDATKQGVDHILPESGSKGAKTTACQEIDL